MLVDLSDVRPQVDREAATAHSFDGNRGNDATIEGLEYRDVVNVVSMTPVRDSTERILVSENVSPNPNVDEQTEANLGVCTRD